MQRAKYITPLAAIFFLLLGPTACATAQEFDLPIPPPLVPRTSPITAPETIAIGVVPQATRVRIAAAGGLLAWNSAGVPHILPEGEFSTLADSRGIGWWFDTTTPGPVSTGWEIRPMAAEAFVLQGVRYRGTLKLVYLAATETTPPRLTAVNILPIEDYLRGVVPREIGTTRIEVFSAIQAQAVAARTYTLRNLGRRRALGFDLFATTDDQVYGGVAAEHPVTDSAIRATAGEVLVFGNDLVEAFYHSTCGGHTTARSDAWSGDQPYLRGVADLIGETAACVSSRYFRWNERYAGETLARLVAPADTLSWSLVTRDTDGRALRLQLVRGDSISSSRGDAIRWFLRRPNGEPLRSTLFTISWDSGVLVVNGRGWGHGIGLCQVGALGRARVGQAYEEILAHYYPGTRIQKLSPPTAPPVPLP